MGVFTKHWHPPHQEPLKTEVVNIPDNSPAENIPCRHAHLWDGKSLTVDGFIHSIQNQEYYGKPCDCGKFLWHESLCGCPGKKHWEGKLIENPDYKSF